MPCAGKFTIAIHLLLKHFLHFVHFFKKKFRRDFVPTWLKYKNIFSSKNAYIEKEEEFQQRETHTEIDR
jgi:hypothetical protein